MYVFPDNVGLTNGTMLTPPQPAHTNEPGVALIIKNSGQTPAYNVISWAMINVIEPINEAHLVVPKLSVSVSINNIGSGGSISKALWFGRASLVIGFLVSKVYTKESFVLHLTQSMWTVWVPIFITSSV